MYPHKNPSRRPFTKHPQNLIIIRYSSIFNHSNSSFETCQYPVQHRIIFIYIMQASEQSQPVVSGRKIVTIVRLRPALRTQDQKQVITLKNMNAVQIDLGGIKRMQKVQMALGPDTTQRAVFDLIQPLVKRVGEGFNVTVMTYGQTGSGKTHTMFGSDWSNIVRRESGMESQRKQAQTTFLRSIEQDQNYAGIIPRTIHLLFSPSVLRRRKHTKIYCSFLQIYNQNMADLLQDDLKVAKQKKLLIHQNKQDGIYVQGLNQIAVEDVEQCLEIMQRGEKNRVVRQTTMNNKSSRSHTIFTLLIEEVFPKDKTYRRMKINLCDLAGSEKIHKGQTMTTAHFEELKNINLSLTTLGKVISTLASSSKTSIAPFRQSKLTRLLQDSLGGNTSTVLVAAIAGKASCLEQSLNTLKFLERARQIKGQVIAKLYSDNPQMRNLQREISYLRDMLKMRGGHLPSDMQLRQKYKALQNENQKLKEMVDMDLMNRLKKENTNLKHQLIVHSNDILSDSQVRLKSQNGLNTIDQHQTINSQKYEKQQLPHLVGSQSNTAKIVRQLKKQDTKSLAARTEDSLSQQNRSTFQRGTGMSMFPSVHKHQGRGTSKILERILEIQRVKQENKIKLERELEMMEKGRSRNEESKEHRRSRKG